MAELRPGHLRCEYLENPLGIDCTRPRLSWVLADWSSWIGVDERDGVDILYKVFQHHRMMLKNRSLEV